MKHVLQFKPQIFIFLVTFGLLFNAFIRGYNPQDEGWVLYGAWRILEGDVPYRNFQYLYTPLSAFLGTLSFLIFDVSILSERILALIIASTVSGVLYSFFQNLKISKNISILLVGIFVVWGPLHTNYLSPSIISIELGIIYAYLLAKSLNTNRNENVKFLFFAGLTSSLILLAKQTFGTAILLHLLILGAYLLIKRHKKSFFYLLFGSFCPVIIFTIYLILTHSLFPFLYEMYSFLILDAASGGFTYQTPLSYPAPILYKIAKITLYSLPLLVSLSAFYLLIKRKSKLTFIPLLAVFFYFVGTQPVFDTIHLTPLIALSCLSLGLLLTQVNYRKIKIALIIISASLLIVGVYNGVFRNYFKWFAPLSSSTTILTTPRAKILVSQNDAGIINPSVDYLVSHSGVNAYIFNYGMTPIFYFLAERPSPSKFTTIETRNVQGENLQILLQDLKTTSPTLIISDGQFRGINPEIETFILENYFPVATIGERPIYQLFSF